MLTKKITPTWLDKSFCLLEIFLIIFDLVFFPYYLFLPDQQNTAYADAASWSQTSFTGADGTYTNTEPKNSNADAGLTNYGGLSNDGGGKWTKKTPVTITNFQANFQTKITVTYDADMQTDFDDIRFYDATASQELPYWIESKTNGVSAIIWFKTGVNNNVFLYYGNASATSSSNGSNTFLFFDNFEQDSVGSNPTKWSVTEAQASYVDVISSPVYEGSKGVKLQTDGGISSPNSDIASNVFTGVTRGVWEYAIRITNASESTYMVMSGAAQGPYMIIHPDLGSGFGVYAYYSGAWNFITSVTTGTWYRIKILFNSDSDTYDIYLNDVLKASNVPYKNATGTLSRVHFTQWWGTLQTTYIDYNIVRKYASPEPTTSAGSETAAYVSSGTLVSNAIGPVTGFYDWGNLTFNRTLNGQTLTVDVLRASDSSVLATNVSSGTDLSTVISNSETSIKIRANFSGDGTNTAVLNDWSVDYSYDTTAPSVPQNLTASAASNSQINLSWNASTDSGGSGLAGYKIERAPDVSGSPGTFSQIDTSVTNSYSDNTGLSSNTKYWYRVRAYDNATNNSDYSTNANGTTLCNTPTGVSANANSISQITVSWSANADSPAHYHVYRGAALAGDDISGTSYPDTTLSTNTQYTYTVKAVNSAGAESAASAATSKYTLIEQPTGVTWGTITSSSIALSATGTLSNLTSGSSGIYFRESITASNSGWIQTNSWNKTTLSANTQYSFYLTVRNGDVASNTELGPYTKYTLADNPTALSASDGTYANKVALSWTSVASASGYKVYRDGIAGIGTQVYDGVALSYDDTGATGSHAYYLYTKNAEESLSDSYVTDSGSLMTVPSAPTAGTPTALSTTSIRWNFTNNASNEEGFKVHDSAHNIKASSATPNLTYLDESSLSANTQYTRHIHAYNAAGDSTSSADMTKYTLAISPTNSSVTADKNASTWYNTTDVVYTNAAGFGGGGVAYYRYVFDQNDSHAFNDTETQWSASTKTLTATANASWYLHVKSYNGDGLAGGTYTYGPYYYDGSQPTDPTSLGASAASVSQINLSWTASTDSGGSSLAGYKIERAPDVSGSPGTFSQIDTSTTNSYSNGSLTANTKYWYRIRAYDNATSNSGYSANVSKVTLANPPIIASATDNYYNNKIVITITSGGNQDHYHVYRDGEAGLGLQIYNGSSTYVEDIITGSHSYYIYSVNTEDAINNSYVTDFGSTAEIVAPSSSNMNQFKVADNSTVIAGGYTNELAIKVKVSQMTGIGSSSSVTPEVEVKESGVSFDGTTNIFAGSAVSYSGSPVDGWVTITGLLDSKSYHFRARVKDNNSVGSSWTTYNLGNTAFSIDQSVPTNDFTAPSSESYLKGTVALSSNATDNIGLTSVEYYDNNLSTIINSTSSFPYLTLWNTTGKNGSHSLYSIARDLAGNRNEVTKTVYVDNFKPRTSAPRKASVKRGKVVKLFFKVDDPYSGGRARVVMKIKKGRRVVKTLNLGLKNTASLQSYRLKAKLAKGKYKFYVYATDRAGNPQYNTASNYLIVK